MAFRGTPLSINRPFAWYPTREEGRLAIAACLATCLEKPRDLTNRWIVSRHEKLALTDPDAVDAHEAGSTDPCPEAELQ